MSVTIRAVLLFIIVSLYCTSLSADGVKDAWKKCSKASDTETKLRECSIAIDGGTLSKDAVANALLIRASAYDERGDHDQAIKDLDDSIKLNPSSFRAIDTRGWEYLRKFEYKRAIEDFDQSILLNPKNPYVYGNRGIAQFLSGNFADAGSDFAKSEGLDAKAVRGFMAIKRILANLRDEKEKGLKPSPSATNYEGDLTHWPGPIVAYYGGGISQEGLLRAAEVPFENERKWKLCQAYFYLGEHALIEGKREEAIELLQGSVDTEARSDPEYVLSEGELRNLRGK